MRTLPKRVQNAYFQLLKSRLISKNHYDNDAINHFEKLLNSSLPQTDYENHIYYFVKDLYYDDKVKFLNYINNSNLQPLILYTNNKNIINHFNLKFKLYINWDKNEKKYIVEKFKKNNKYNSSNSSNSGNNSDSSSNSQFSNNSNNSNNNGSIVSNRSVESLQSIESFNSEDTINSSEDYNSIENSSEDYNSIENSSEDYNSIENSSEYYNSIENSIENNKTI
jgi:hypothetical protein